MKGRTTHSWLGSVALWLCVFGARPNVQASPDKYLDHGRDKQNVIQTEVARLATSSGDVPIVATVERDRVALYWWNSGVINPGNPSGRPRWQFHDRPYTPIAHVAMASALDQTVTSQEQWAWSSRVGLAVGNGQVFLVHKRRIGTSVALWVDRFIWDNPTRNLRPAGPAPIAVPIGQLGFIPSPGYYIWSGFAAGRLIILAQLRPTGATARAFQLVQLSGDISQDLALAASWDSPPRVIGVGGYDVQGRIDGSLLTCVYRRTAHSVVAPIRLPALSPFMSTTTGSVDLDRLALAPSIAPLSLRQLDLAAATQTLAFDDLPGGEHPHIQSVNPLYVTVDRIRALGVRAARARNALLNFRDPGKLVVRVRLAEYEKLLIRQSTSGWASGVLEVHDRAWLPRTTLRAPPLQFLTELQDGTPASLGLVLVPDVLPMFMVGHSEQVVEGTKRYPVDFMMHDFSRRALVVSRYLIDPNSQDLSPEEYGHTIHDLNHDEVVEPQAMQPTAFAENLQFAPFQFEYPPDVDLATPRVLALPPIQFVDDTIGGALAVDQSRAGTKFYAYCDLGDGGARVIFNESFPPPDPQPPATKLLDATQIVDGASGEDEWIDVLQSQPFEPSDVSAYSTAPDGLLSSVAQSIHCGIEPGLDQLLREVGGAMASGQSRTVREADCEVLQQLIHDVVPASEFSASAESTPRARIQFRPARPFAGTPVMLSASLEGGATLAIESVTWEFGGNTNAASGVDVSHTFTEAGDVSVTATVRLSDGAERRVQATIPVATRLWDEIWSMCDDVSEQLADAQDAKLEALHISIAKYDVSYVRPRGDRERVEIAMKEKQDTAFRLRGTPRQGTIEYWHNVELDSDRVEIGGVRGLAYDLDRFAVRFRYGRQYTPGILVSDQRSRHPSLGSWGSIETTNLPISEATGRRVTALSAKPIGGSSLQFISANAEVSITAVGFIVEALLLLGLVALAITLLGLWGALAAAMATPGGWVAALIIAVTIAIMLLFVIPAEIERRIESDIAEFVSAPSTKTLLDSSGIATYAGEGAAETLALRAIKQPLSDGTTLPLDAEGKRSGRNRFRDQTWQMVVVLEGRARILVRR